jgi:hypothetical protein
MLFLVSKIARRFGPNVVGRAASLPFIQAFLGARRNARQPK